MTDTFTSELHDIIDRAVTAARLHLDVLNETIADKCIRPGHDALHAVAEPDGTIHQSRMRSLIRGRIAPKSIGTLYRKAKAEGLIVDTGEREPSDDVAGRNTDKLDRVYRLGRAA